MLKYHSTDYGVRKSRTWLFARVGKSSSSRPVPFRRRTGSHESGNRQLFWIHNHRHYPCRAALAGNGRVGGMDRWMVDGGHMRAHEQQCIREGLGLLSTLIISACAEEREGERVCVRVGLCVGSWMKEDDHYARRSILRGDHDATLPNRNLLS